MLLIGSSQVQQWDRRGKPHSGTAPAKRPQFLYPDFLLPVQRKEQRTCGAGPLLLVPVTGLEPVRCRQRRILSPLRLPIPSHRQVQELLYAIAVPFASKILRSNGESKVYVAFMIAGKSDRANCPGHFWQKW